MRTIKQNGMMWLYATLTIIFTCQDIQAQQFNLNNSKSDMTILGTSSLHDWHEVVEEHSGSIELTAEGEMEISKLNISIVAESIKSDKSAMDKNTYKALKTEKYKTITFKMIDSKKVTSLGNSVYQVTISGKLCITGVTKTIDLTFKMKVDSGVVTLKGEESFNMTDYGIEPPKALFGTITTGDKITIKFNSVFN